MSSVDTNIGIGTIDLEDLIGKPSDEIMEELREVMEDMTTEERAELLEQLPDTLGDIEESLFALIEELEEDIDETDNETQEERLEAEVDELEEMMDLLEDVDDYAADVNNELSFYEQDISSSTTIDYTGQVQEGDEILLNVEGSESSGLFEDDDETSDEALPQYSTNVTVNIGYDQVSLLGYENGKTTFSITTEEGITFHLVFQGEPCQITFSGNSYIDPNTLNSWPDELLQRCYDGSSNQCFYYNVYGYTSEEAVESTIVGEDVLENLSSEYSEISALLEQSSIYDYQSSDANACRSALTSEQQQLIEDALMQLLGSDLYISGSDTTIEEAWDEIYTMLQNADSETKNAVFGSLVYMIGKYDSDNYASVFPASVDSHLEEALLYGNYVGDTADDGMNDTSVDAFSIAMILINEQYSATPMGYSSASFADPTENELALTFLDNNMPNMAVSNELSEASESAANNPVVNMDSTTTDTLSAWASDALEDWTAAMANDTSDYAEAIGEGDTEEQVDEQAEIDKDNTMIQVSNSVITIMNELASITTETGDILASEITSAILAQLNGLTAEIQGHVASMVVCMICMANYELGQSLMETADMETIKGMITTSAEYGTEALALINGTAYENPYADEIAKFEDMEYGMFGMEDYLMRQAYDATWMSVDNQVSFWEQHNANVNG